METPTGFHCVTQGQSADTWRASHALYAGQDVNSAAGCASTRAAQLVIVAANGRLGGAAVGWW